jgi:hypothetical protein
MFGTSGVRGPVGDEVTAGLALDIGRALATDGVETVVLGRGVNFVAGTNVANLRHDDEPVRMTVKGDRVDTGRRKIGAIVGDEAKTGINTSVNYPTLLAHG